MCRNDGREDIKQRRERQDQTHGLHDEGEGHDNRAVSRKDLGGSGRSLPAGRKAAARRRGGVQPKELGQAMQREAARDGGEGVRRAAMGLGLQVERSKRDVLRLRRRIYKL